MPEPEEETAEEQPDDSRSVLEDAYDKAVAKEEEPEEVAAKEPEKEAAPAEEAVPEPEKEAKAEEVIPRKNPPLKRKLRRLLSLLTLRHIGRWSIKRCSVVWTPRPSLF